MPKINRTEQLAEGQMNITMSVVFPKGSGKENVAGSATVEQNPLQAMLIGVQMLEKVLTAALGEEEARKALDQIDNAVLQAFEKDGK